MRRPTLEDIAAEAGVSMMSVSRAINGQAGIGPELRRRILETAERLGYRPNRAARGLARQRTSTLGLVLPDISNPYFALLAKAAADVARAADHNVLILNSDEDAELEAEALATLAAEAVDGVVVAGSRLPDEHLAKALEGFAASVLVNRNPPPGSPCDAVNVDDEAGAAEAIAYLAGQGRRRIALVSGPAASASGTRRLAGYKAGLAARGLAFDPRLVERCEPTLEGGAAAITALIGREPGIDAVLAFNDVVAIGAMRELKSAGCAIPADVAVVGADDVPFAALVQPALTTLGADVYAIGSTAMSRLLALAAGELLEPLPFIRPRLVRRESA